jgi:HEAT repeat protein
MIVMMSNHTLKRAAIIGAAAAMLSGCAGFAERMTISAPAAVKVEPRQRTTEDGYHKMVFLMGRLMMGEEEERAEAAGKLGILRDARAVPALVNALKDHSKLVRGNAAWALGEIGDIGAVPALKQTLEDEDQMIRQDASVALSKIETRNGPASARIR